MTTVFSAFERTARAHGTQPFLQFLPDKVEYRYGEALEAVRAIARRYGEAGYRAGHRVALGLPTSPQFLLHFLALNSIGAVVVPLNPEAREAERAYVVSHSEASAVVTRSNLDSPPPPRGPGTATECALLYTSGTTGRPKGCLLSNFYFLNLGQRYLNEGGLCEVRPGAERLATPLPLFHMNALCRSSTRR